jgi:hypothetical protein
VLLKVRFHELFLICSEPEALVEEVVKEGVWRIRFRRQLSEHQQELWRELEGELRGVVITIEGDRVKWVLEKDGQILTKSLYRYLSFGGVSSRRMREV